MENLFFQFKDHEIDAIDLYTALIRDGYSEEDAIACVALSILVTDRRFVHLYDIYPNIDDLYKNEPGIVAQALYSQSHVLADQYRDLYMKNFGHDIPLISSRAFDALMNEDD